MNKRECLGGLHTSSLTRRPERVVRERPSDGAPSQRQPGEYLAWRHVGTAMRAFRRSEPTGLEVQVWP